MVPSSPNYIHGYNPRESRRLIHQADVLRDLVHSGTAYPAGSVVLEIGCGTGAQTLTLHLTSPGARIVGVDRSALSLREARANARAAGCTNVAFYRADIHALPFATASFDHVFGCFVLEHLARPLDALIRLKGVMKPGATITLFEGDHGTVVLDSPSDRAYAAIACQAELQHRAGGDAMIGRRLGAMIAAAGFTSVEVSPRIVHARAAERERTPCAERAFAAMIESVRERAIGAGLIDAGGFDDGMEDLRTVFRSGTFTYTFFKAVATCA